MITSDPTVAIFFLIKNSNGNRVTPTTVLTLRHVPSGYQNIILKWDDKFLLNIHFVGNSNPINLFSENWNVWSVKWIKNVQFYFSLIRMNVRTTSECWPSPSRPTSSSAAPTASTQSAGPTRQRPTTKPTPPKPSAARRARPSRASAWRLKSTGYITSSPARATVPTIPSTTPPQFLQVRKKTLNVL